MEMSGCWIGWFNVRTFFCFGLRTTLYLQHIRETEVMKIEMIKIMQDLWNEVVVAALSGLAVGLAPYLYSLRKERQLIRTDELDNVQKAVGIWRNLSQELEEKVKKLQERIEEIEATFKEKCDNCKYRKYYENRRNGD